jgi:two-component system chemotaxis response regulator CheB
VSEVHTIVMGGSTGAIEVLLTILSKLPVHSTPPVVVVVHVPRDVPSLLSDVFAPQCALRVKEAEDKEPLARGTVYFAPPDYHVLIEQDRSLALSADDPVLHSRPSIDVLFESAAVACGPGLVAVLVTGASKDGAAGIAAIGTAGGVTIVQSPEEAKAAEMPRAAIAACPQCLVLTAAEIASWLVQEGDVRV